MNIKIFGLVYHNILIGLILLHWSERPLRQDWNHLRSDDREVAFVWSTEHLFAGCPDLIGEIGGVRVIADFKTSNGPYMNTFPQRGDRVWIRWLP